MIEGTRAKPRLELGAAVMEYIEQTDEFIGTKILPIFKTPKKAASFSAITRESIASGKDTKRGPGGKYNREGFGAGDLSYKCIEHGMEGPLDDGERALYASDFDAELVISKITARRVLLAQERRIAAAIFNTSTFTGAALYKDNSGAPWDAIGSDVIGQIDTAKQRVRANVGMLPNALIVSSINIDRLKANTAIRESIKYTARVTEAEILNALADILGLKQIIIGGAIYNSAKKGQDFVSADVWSDDYALLAVVNDSQSLAEPNVGRTFLWTEDSPENATVEQYRDEDIRSDVFRVRQHTDEKLLDAYFAHLMKVDA